MQTSGTSGLLSHMCRESLCCRQGPDGKRTQGKLYPTCLSYRAWDLRVQYRKSVLKGVAEGLGTL